VAGSVFGPWGAVIGGAVGLLGGLSGGFADAEARDAAIKRQRQLQALFAQQVREKQRADAEDNRRAGDQIRARIEVAMAGSGVITPTAVLAQAGIDEALNKSRIDKAATDAIRRGEVQTNTGIGEIKAGQPSALQSFVTVFTSGLQAAGAISGGLSATSGPEPGSSPSLTAPYDPLSSVGGPR